MQNLSQQRKGEIALSIFEYAMKKKLQQHFEGWKREMGNIAKESGVPYGELKSFLRPLAQSVLDEMFKDDESKHQKGSELPSRI